MPDMIPASKIATAALAQVQAAANCVPRNYHDDDKIKQQAVHLQVAAELLGLISEPPVFAQLAEDGTLTFIPPGTSPPSIFPPPTTPAPPKK